jgi:light-regulated signal transduction histidine kinase (bacteriophytochrome)
VRERTAQLEAANKELEAFSYSVSHDLRAPLRGIDGYARILEEDYYDKLDDEGRRVLGVVRSEARRMGALIDNLLTFSRLGRQRVESTEINMTALARDVFDRLVEKAEGPPVRFDLAVLPPARGDIAMVRQVLVNLIGNAIKFTRREAAPVVEVGGTAADGTASYFVRDNGVGFDEAFKDKLFRVFQRLHSEEEFEGTGVGLALVHRIVNRHGGEVRAEGRPGGGATFHFTLPGGRETE